MAAADGGAVGGVSGGGGGVGGGGVSGGGADGDTGAGVAAVLGATFLAPLRNRPQTPHAAALLSFLRLQTSQAHSPAMGAVGDEAAVPAGLAAAFFSPLRSRPQTPHADALLPLRRPQTPHAQSPATGLALAPGAFPAESCAGDTGAASAPAGGAEPGGRILTTSWISNHCCLPSVSMRSRRPIRLITVPNSRVPNFL